ncbi:carbohydrate ABC transporter permease [Salinactinospora qingdaonensis]|uniref:Carbohydrate ABC transporter permease n=1 Tax=Salinactinospora qingdaonensis TaxID=702744 RepID=A0ABP7G6W1_9ACTN
MDTDSTAATESTGGSAGASRPRHPQRPVWEEPPGRVAQGLKGATLAVVILVVLGPLWVVLATSLSDEQTITEAGGLVIIPDGITFDAYWRVLSGGVVTRAVLVSVGVTAVGTAISMFASVLCAYGLSRSGSFGHRTILFTLLFTMLFQAGMIPTYLLVDSLGMRDTYWALILPTAISAFNILVLRAFFMNVAPEMIESARIDGASELRILVQIVLPVSKAVIAVITLFYAVGYWSSWFNAMLYLDHADKWPLQLVLRSYVLQQQSLPSSGATSGIDAMGQVPSLAIQMAVMIIAVVPVLIVYPFVQRHFTKGMLTGAIKG